MTVKGNWGDCMQSEGHLLRVLGLAFGLAAVVGSVIGQGILRSPGAVAEASSSGWVIIGLWVLGAAISIVSAMPYAELASAIPRAGGPYAYAVRAFGEKAGVAIAFSVLIAFVTAEAQLCFVVGEFLYRLGVGGGRFAPGVLGLAALVLFCAVNAAGTRVSGAAQVVLSTLKGVALLALVIVFFAQPGIEPALDQPASGAGWLAFAIAMLLILGTYNGWADLVVYGEEIENPGRAIPRALFGGIAGVTAIYLLVNLALLHLLTSDGMAGSTFAAADAAGLVFGQRGDTVLTALGALSVGAIASLGLMSTTRITYAAARAGILPHVLAKVGSHGTPVRAMLLVAVLAALFIVSGTYLALSSAAVSINQFNLIVVGLCAIVLRRREPGMPRPFRMPLFPLMIGLGLLVNTVLLAVFVFEDPLYGLSGFALVGLLWSGYLVLARHAARVA
jgi:APA family basic amino acid/polyamine antiporter